MLSPLGLYACCMCTSILTIARFASSSYLGVETLQCDTDFDRNSTTTTTTTAYYDEREQPLTICHGQASNEAGEKHQLHIFEVEETIYAPNDLSLAGGVGVMTAVVRTSYLSSPSRVAFVVTKHAVNLDVFIEGDGGLKEIYLITPWKTKSSVSVTSITPTPRIIQLDCSDITTPSTKLLYSTTSRCEREQIYRYFYATLNTVTTVTQTERADEWIIDMR
ncbi:uncharacterized protein LOC105440606 [Strongylocentrotus purpuratus]|uniref:Uncharacterized protein n=1 Tax=Strongylocentrotus purpuratus TaxID=7668 RepID=A0A7M7STT9_STRPU|nr:uncharacterized protein LOC105440606 [Strongylocentrotus purpuratus]